MKDKILIHILSKVTKIKIIKIGAGNKLLYSMWSSENYYKTYPKKGLLIKYLKEMIT